MTKQANGGDVIGEPEMPTPEELVRMLRRQASQQTVLPEHNLMLCAAMQIENYNNIKSTNGGKIQAGEDEAPTVEELIKFLSRFNDNLKVRGYEGEGGSWIIVDSYETYERK